MGGRGTFAAGYHVPYMYEAYGMIHGVKVLRGIKGKHGLPESAHSSRAYILLGHDGRFKEMRIYDENHCLYLEIAYHNESKLSKTGKPVLHFHQYCRDFSATRLNGSLRSPAMKLTPRMKKAFKRFYEATINDIR